MQLQALAYVAMKNLGDGPADPSSRAPADPHIRQRTKTKMIHMIVPYRFIHGQQYQRRNPEYELKG